MANFRTTERPWGSRDEKRRRRKGSNKHLHDFFPKPQKEGEGVGEGRERVKGGRKCFTFSPRM